jgi:hypothetical protein
MKERRGNYKEDSEKTGGGRMEISRRNVFQYPSD